MPESWSYEFTEHAPVTKGAEALRSRHEPKVRLPGAPADRGGSSHHPPEPVSDGEPTMNEHSPLPAVDRRTMERRLAERRAKPATPPAKMAAPVRAPEPAAGWRWQHLAAVLAALVMGFLAGSFLAQRQPPNAEEGLELRLDTHIGAVAPPQESSRRLASPSATQ